MDMDFREPTRHYPQQPAYREAPPQQQPQQRPPEYNEAPPQYYGKKGGKGKGFFKFLLILILIAGAGAGAWYYRDKQAKDDAKQQAQQISDLQDQLNTARDAAAAAKSQTATTTQSGPSEDTLKKVEDAISSGKYTDLKVLMGDKVYVVVAASDGLGGRTPEQAVNDLKTLASTKDWDFKLAAKTVATYQDGDYSVYFPAGALVGKSSDGHVVSVVFNDEGKITGILMAASDKDL